MNNSRKKDLGEPGHIRRNQNLDLIRATAICMVLVYHGTAMCPIAIPGLSAITRFGEYGVDLFFVLSGWLIGGLYWQERHKFGDVLIGRFWIRRWMRTIPAYLAALLFSYLAVLYYRNENFDFLYLVFGQNYLAKVPFFEVSWSLCVEEHFYLLTPVLFLFWGGQKYRRSHIILPAIAFAAPALFRSLGHPDSAAFGYAQTATHLRSEGLILGFYAAYVSVYSSSDFKVLQKCSGFFLLVSLGCLAVLVIFANKKLYYIFWGSTISVFFTSWLIFMILRTEMTSIGRLYTPIAVCSYSTYLTHALAIHVARQLTLRLPEHDQLAYFPIMLTVVVVFSILFFKGIEKPALRLRDICWPRRGEAIGGAQIIKRDRAISVP